MSSNLAMLDCWLLCLKAQLVKHLSNLIFLPKIIQNFHKGCPVSHLTLFLLGEFRTSSKSGVWKFDSGHHQLDYVETFADMKTPSWSSIEYIEQVMMTSNYYLGMCGHVDTASVLVGHLALLLRHLMLLFISIIFVVRFFFLIIITTVEHLFATSGGISW